MPQDKALAFLHCSTLNFRLVGASYLSTCTLILVDAPPQVIRGWPRCTGGATFYDSSSAARDQTALLLNI